MVGTGIAIEKMTRSSIVEQCRRLKVVVITEVNPGSIGRDSDVPFAHLPVPGHAFLAAGAMGGTFPVLLVLVECDGAQVITAVVQAVAVDVVDALVGLGIQ